MEKEFVTRFVTATICIVLTVVIITTALIPIISDASTKTELAPAEGAYGFMSYQPDPEPSSGLPYRYVYATWGGSDGMITISHGPANAMQTIESMPTTEFFNTDRIVYADSNIVIYVSNGSIYYDYDGQTTQGDYLERFWVQNDGNGVSKATVGSTTVFSDAPVPTYYYAPDPNGDYANFEGDNPPTMDTPSVSVAGMYIGTKVIEKTVESPYAAVYLVIPLIVLVSLLMMCVREFMRIHN